MAGCVRVDAVYMLSAPAAMAVQGSKGPVDYGRNESKFPGRTIVYLFKNAVQYRSVSDMIECVL